MNPSRVGQKLLQHLVLLVKLESYHMQAFPADLASLRNEGQALIVNFSMRGQNCLLTNKDKGIVIKLPPTHLHIIITKELDLRKLFPGWVLGAFGISKKQSNSRCQKC
ncbi:hypothetical protein QE152_g29983 [Popillia japonica]|uniref:Uncharacterized protein n=1 Tax=Popillia japonica TaxID=7064 RepID=A0AAW1JFP0_POPJA